MGLDPRQRLGLLLECYLGIYDAAEGQGEANALVLAMAQDRATEQESFFQAAENVVAMCPVGLAAETLQRVQAFFSVCKQAVLSARRRDVMLGDVPDEFCGQSLKYTVSPPSVLPPHNQLPLRPPW